MARKQRRTKTNTYLWYALYAVAGYYAYNWWAQRQKAQILTEIVKPTT